MRIPIFIVLVMILNSMVIIAAAEEPLNKSQTLNEIADDLSTLERMVDETNSMIQQYQQAKVSGVIPGNLTVTSQNAVIHKGAGGQTAELTAVEEGASLKVIDKVGEWYAVSLDKPVEGLNTGWINSQEIVPAVTVSPITEASFSSFMDRKFNDILAMVSKMKEKYKNNPYVRVAGFRIGLPPSVQVEIEFKEVEGN